MVGSFPLVTQASATQGSCGIPTSSFRARTSNTDELERVLNDLKANGYPDGQCLNNKTKPGQSQERPLKFAVPPYAKGASVGRLIRNFHVRPALSI